MKRNYIFVGSVLLAIALAVFTARAAFYFIDDVMPAFKSAGTIHIDMESDFESTIADITATLQPRDTISVKRALKQELKGRKLSPGMYSFTRRHTARFLARSITRGWQEPIMVVLDGQMRSRKELADRLSLFMMASSDDFLKVMNDSLLLDQYGTTPSRLFSKVIPDSYQMYWSATPQEVIDRLMKEYDRYWNEERRAAAKKQGLTPYQVSVLASIVSQESNRKSELPKIASVYLTRLRKGWKLQACPTVCYIYDYQITRVLYRHLKTDSPYNTYMYEGLPPTPICVPPKACLEAVLHPDDTPYLYFCADSSLNGSNHFSTSFAEHQKYAAMYKKTLDRQKSASLEK